MMELRLRENRREMNRLSIEENLQAICAEAPPISKTPTVDCRPSV